MCPHQCGKQILAHMQFQATLGSESRPTGTVVILWHTTARLCRQSLRGGAAMLGIGKCCTGTAFGTQRCTGTAACLAQGLLRWVGLSSSNAPVRLAAQTLAPGHSQLAPLWC